MTGEGGRQHDCERDEQAEDAERGRPGQREEHRERQHHGARGQDRAEVRACHDVRDGDDSDGEGRSTHDLRSEDEIGKGHQHQDHEAPGDQPAEADAGGFERGSVVRKDEPFEDEPADHGRQAEEPEAANQAGEEKRQVQAPLRPGVSLDQE